MSLPFDPLSQLVTTKLTADDRNSTTGGNTVYLHLFIDALAIQPCNPTCEFY